ncbi:MAG TPA: Slp family lipoprotein [Nitrospirales bacterium]|nr:Slp family lipoprotein [Nitrospirales bacterium]
MSRTTTIVMVLLALGCAQSAHQTGRDVFDKTVPKGLQRDIDWRVSFPELQTAASSYEGRTIVLGGIVLNSKRTNRGTEIEMLQVPLNGGLSPTGDRTTSQGRFLAVQPDGLDPASIEKGTHLTVVGTVDGTETRSFDETQYTYPVVQIRRLVNWTQAQRPRYYGYGPGYDYPYYGYYAPYRPYWPYWWGGPYASPYVPYYLYGPGLSAPPPNPSPPPQNVPPQFRKRD